MLTFHTERPKQLLHAPHDSASPMHVQSARYAHALTSSSLASLKEWQRLAAWANTPRYMQPCAIRGDHLWDGESGEQSLKVRASSELAEPPTEL